MPTVEKRVPHPDGIQLGDTRRAGPSLAQLEGNLPPEVKQKSPKNVSRPKRQTLGFTGGEMPVPVGSVSAEGIAEGFSTLRRSWVKSGRGWS